MVEILGSWLQIRAGRLLAEVLDDWGRGSQVKGYRVHRRREKLHWRVTNTCWDNGRGLEDHGMYNCEDPGRSNARTYPWASFVLPTPPLYIPNLLLLLNRVANSTIDDALHNADPCRIVKG